MLRNSVGKIQTPCLILYVGKLIRIELIGVILASFCPWVAQTSNACEHAHQALMGSALVISSLPECRISPSAWLAYQFMLFVERFKDESAVRGTFMVKCQFATEEGKRLVDFLRRYPIAVVAPVLPLLLSSPAPTECAAPAWA